MSAEIVVAAPVALSPALLVLALGGAVVTGAAAAGSTLAKAMEEAEERQREARLKELNALASEIDKLARARAKAAPPELSEEFIEENRRSILAVAGSLRFEEAEAAPPAPEAPGESAGSGAPEGGAGDCRELFARLALIDAEAAKGVEPLIAGIEAAPKVRRGAVRDSLRMEYGNALRRASARVWRGRRLREALSSLSGEAAREFNASLVAAGFPARVPDEGEFAALWELFARVAERDARRKQAELMEQRLAVEMKKLGYSQAGGSAASGEPRFFFTGSPDYRIMARVDPRNGNLSLRFVRVVASEAEKRAITEGRRRRDKEMERKWCEKASALLRALAEDAGRPLEELYRSKPEDGRDLLAVVDPSLARKDAPGARRYDG